MVRVRTVTKSIDHGGLTNHLASHKLNMWALQMLRLSLGARPVKSNTTDAPHMKAWMQRSPGRSLVHTKMCRSRWTAQGCEGTCPLRETE